MTTFPIGIQTRSFRLPLRQSLRQASQMGADGVEIDVRHELQIADFSQTALRQFRKLLEDSGLRVAAVAFPTRRGLGDTEGLERRLLAIREAMSFAYKIGARIVLHHAERLPALAEEEEGGDDPGAQTLLESLTLLAEHGDRVGARFAISSGADPQVQSQLFEHLPEGIIGAALHPASLITAGADPVEAASLLGERVLYVHAVDAVREFAGGGSGQAVEVELGRGAADLPSVLGTLEEHGYRGWVTAQRHAGSDPVGDLANAVAYLRAI